MQLIIVFFFSIFVFMQISPDTIGKDVNTISKHYQTGRFNNEEEIYGLYSIKGYQIIAPQYRDNYTFNNYPVAYMGVIENEGKIKEISLFIEPFNFEIFISGLVIDYGMPETTGLSKEYLNHYGYETPDLYSQKVVDSIYSNLPLPNSNNLHLLRSMSWYDLGKDKNVILRVSKTNIAGLDAKNLVKIVLVFDKTQ